MPDASASKSINKPKSMLFLSKYRSSLIFGRSPLGAACTVVVWEYWEYSEYSELEIRWHPWRSLLNAFILHLSSNLQVPLNAKNQNPWDEESIKSCRLSRPFRPWDITPPLLTQQSLNIFGKIPTIPGSFCAGLPCRRSPSSPGRPFS